MKLQPLGNRILVRRKESEEKTTGGIYIPDTAKEKNREGEVIAVSPAVKDVKKGDKILFESYAGSEVSVAGEKLVIMDIKDVIGVYEV
ncbi:co-chaperone GroES [Candidatus Woesearchaeota archaeon]|nr:co-chaperone GroES [Candidatus Woesearchaeota archaeon]